MNKDKIIIKGARVNNLKNINVEIPRDQLVIMTGLSGSGKHHWHLIRFMRKDKDAMLNH